MSSMKLILVGAALLAGVLASGSASAQIVERTEARDYGMVQLKPENLALNSRPEILDVSILLPAVQKVRLAAARILVKGEGFQAEIPVFGYLDRSRVARVSIWTSEVLTPAGPPKVLLNFKDQMGELRQIPISGNDVAITILPAVQQEVEILSASVRITSVAEAVQADGSVRPVYVGTFLPAVQKVRG